jgi:hypothetical protein
MTSAFLTETLKCDRSDPSISEAMFLWTMSSVNASDSFEIPRVCTELSNSPPRTLTRFYRYWWSIIRSQILIVEPGSSCARESAQARRSAGTTIRRKTPTLQTRPSFPLLVFQCTKPQRRQQRNASWVRQLSSRKRTPPRIRARHTSDRLCLFQTPVECQRWCKATCPV